MTVSAEKGTRPFPSARALTCGTNIPKPLFLRGLPSSSCVSPRFRPPPHATMEVGGWCSPQRRPQPPSNTPKAAWDKLSHGNLPRCPVFSDLAIRPWANLPHAASTAHAQGCWRLEGEVGLTVSMADPGWTAGQRAHASVGDNRVSSGCGHRPFFLTGESSRDTRRSPAAGGGNRHHSGHSGLVLRGCFVCGRGSLERGHPHCRGDHDGARRARGGGGTGAAASASDRGRGDRARSSKRRAAVRMRERAS